ncbi:MAG: YbaK/EbsC family protein [Rhodospirillaceae bacterium]|nr:YbaK/EbsC family protein [Rhodospirillaceae bacterium]MBT4691673.1 YbaK/EbsC family protein [Rhodospirillaceae bacterium]MBT5082174.1 YbaK/EbsC family protein [Rhodospirillaceae bacterium]MBT5526693.1 YbaK/EbsC family protein [Rhodospirillaceae bacterium]MBT5878469.1 YbaK/EbsC family protein [Rhodospirillaceae bacterium]
MRFQRALLDAGSSANVIALTETARTAQDAADSVECALGAIVKSLVFRVEGRAVLALVAGDRQCDTKALPLALGMTGKCKRADADLVRAATGFAIGGVAPLGHPTQLPTAIDQSLGRFETLYAAAGHPYCVFPTNLAELVNLTGGSLSDQLSHTIG